MKTSLNTQIAKSLREIVFGLEDGLVSTLGTLTGVAVGTQNASVVVLSGLVLVAVEATSMAAGSYLSSKTAQEAERVWSGEKKDVPLDGDMDLFQAHPVQAGMVMWVFYVIGGAVPLLPYLLFSFDVAFWVSILCTVGTLFAVGAGSSFYTKRPAMRSAIEMVTVSCVAALLGYVIGRVAGIYLPITP